MLTWGGKLSEGWEWVHPYADMETLLGRILMSVLAEREQKRLWEEPRAKGRGAHATGWYLLVRCCARWRSR